MLVSQILAAKEKEGVISIGPQEEITQATRMLATHKIGALIVLNEDGHLAGIISERDIVRSIGVGGVSTLAQNVAKLMSAQVVTCTIDETADEILDKMTQGRFRHLPVVQDGQVIAMISIGDIVKARLEELGREKQALEDYIAH